MDERILKLRTSKDAEKLARNAARNGRPDIAEQASVRALELKELERAARRHFQASNLAIGERKPNSKERGDRPALFINGVFEEVLNEILDAQALSEVVCYLQPYKPALIKGLQEDPPSPERPWRLFMSLTHSLGLVSFEAEIVDWADKSTLGSDKIGVLNQHFAAYQPRERALHFESEAGGEYGRNLLGIVDLRRIEPALTVSGFIKVSDDLPLRDRTRAGGWSYVNPPQLREFLEVVGEEIARSSESKELVKALKRSGLERKKRLEEANPLPQQIFVLTKVFRRNQDVVAEVLERSNGSCEGCGQFAPFLRARDGNPYLEVHHVMTLAQGGADTVENAIALCPNCHRKRHYG